MMHTVPRLLRGLKSWSGHKPSINEAAATRQQNQAQQRGMESRRSRNPFELRSETRDHLSVQRAEAYREGGAGA